MELPEMTWFKYNVHWNRLVMLMHYVTPTTNCTYSRALNRVETNRSLNTKIEVL